MVIGGRNKLSQFNDIYSSCSQQWSIRERYQIQVSWSDHTPASYGHIELLQSKIAKRLGVLNESSIFSQFMQEGSKCQQWSFLFLNM